MGRRFPVILYSVAFTFCASPAGAQSTDLYVNYSYPGLERGTQVEPYDTTQEALSFIAPGGTIHIAPGSSHEVLTINQSVRLEATSTLVRIGDLSSPNGSGSPYEKLRITEIMYNPSDGGAEFLELQNTGATSLDVSGCFFSDGIIYTFPGGSVLNPGEYAILVRDTDSAAFLNLYSEPIFGLYSGALSNDGETIEVSDPSANVFLRLTYNDNFPWPASADGIGFSLVIQNPQAVEDDPSNWRASAEEGGNPNDVDIDPNTPGVLVNEALTHTDLPSVDAIEIYNPTGSSVDIRGWFLSDSKRQPQKALIPNDAQYANVPAGGYVVVDETVFFDSPGSVGGNPLPGFRLSSNGDDAYIFSADGTGSLTGYAHGFDFGAAENGVSFGRVVTSDGRDHFVAQLSTTLGSANAGPKFGPIVISEIHYNPLTNDIEYLELTNTSGSPVNLWDTVTPDTDATFHIDGIGFSFPPSTTMPAGGTFLIVDADPAEYATAYPAAAGSVDAVFGPFGNDLEVGGDALSNGGETIRLQWPDELDTGVSPPLIPYIAMDPVKFNDNAPWPNADGNGLVLVRTNLSGFGGEPTNWSAQAANYPGTKVQPLAFSVPRGFYAGSQSVNITTPTASATIRFTSDGTLPTSSSTALFSALGVNSNEVIRARGFKAGMLPSDTATHSYFINVPSNESALRAVSIVADPNESLFLPNGVMAIQGGTYVPSTFNTLEWNPNLPNDTESQVISPLDGQPWFDALGDPVYPEGGPDDPSAYNNPIQSGSDFERPTSFEIIDPSDNSFYVADTGIRVHGSPFHRPRYAMDPNGDWTQPQLSSISEIILASYLKFSLRIYFRGKYGPSNLTGYEIFPGDTLLSYDKIVLRGGHNDGYNPFIKDELTRRLFIDMGQVNVRGTLVNVFINGVYRGYYNATERLDDDFFRARYGGNNDWDILIQPANVAFFPLDPQVRAGDLDAWNELFTYAAADLSVQANYDAVAARLDIANFIDYLLVQLYAGNDDWPNNNWTAARERKPGGKYRFYVWDAEATFISLNENKTGINWFPFWQWPTGGPPLRTRLGGAGLYGDFGDPTFRGEHVPIGILFRALIDSDLFRFQFALRAHQLLDGGLLDNAHVQSRFAELEADMVNVMPSGVTFNDYIETGWIPARKAVLTADLSAIGLY